MSVEGEKNQSRHIRAALDAADGGRVWLGLAVLSSEAAVTLKQHMRTCACGNQGQYAGQ